MTFVEFMSPRGHVTFNSFYIKNLMSKEDVLVIGESLISEYNQFDPISFKDESGSLLSRFKNTVRGILAVNKNQKNISSELIILSYDIAFIFLIKFLLNGYSQRKIYAFIHNAYPSSIIKLLLLYFVKDRVVFISFSEHIANSIRMRGFKSIVLKLPMLRINTNTKLDCIDRVIIKSKKFKGVVYCASGSTPKTEIEKFAIKYIDYLIVSKKNFPTKLSNIEFVVDYECYGKMLELSDYIYIYFPYEDRVSGVLYDALAFNKKIIVNEGIFGSDAIIFYPNNVGLSIEDLILKKSYYDCDQYNKNLIDSLNLFME